MSSCSEWKSCSQTVTYSRKCFATPYCGAFAILSLPFLFSHSPFLLLYRFSLLSVLPCSFSPCLFCPYPLCLSCLSDRLVESSELRKACEMKYAAVMPQVAHPFLYFAIYLPADQVDVNVSPTKREVRAGSEGTGGRGALCASSMRAERIL